MLQFISNIIKDFACSSVEFQFSLPQKVASLPLQKIRFSVELLEACTFVCKDLSSPFLLCSARVSLAKLLLRKALDKEVEQDSQETELQ